jgi:hypothetical protein
MDSLPVVIALAVFGLLAIIAGVIVWRGAERIVEDARRELEGMFGDRAGLQGSPPSSSAARIAGACFALVGVALVVVAAVILLLG